MTFVLGFITWLFKRINLTALYLEVEASQKREVKRNK
jgi:hypothetical protein